MNDVQYDYVGSLGFLVVLLLISAIFILAVPLWVQVAAVVAATAISGLGLWSFFGSNPSVRTLLMGIINANPAFRRVLYANAVLTAAVIVGGNLAMGGAATFATQALALVFSGIGIAAMLYAFKAMAETPYAAKGREYSSSHFNKVRGGVFTACLVAFYLVFAGFTTFGSFANRTDISERLMAQPLTEAERAKIKAIQDDCKKDSWGRLCRYSSTAELTEIIKRDRVAEAVKQPANGSASLMGSLAAFLVLVPSLAAFSLLAWMAYFLVPTGNKKFTEELDRQLRIFIKETLQIAPNEKNLEMTKEKMAETGKLQSLVREVARWFGVHPEVAWVVVSSRRPVSGLVKPVFYLKDLFAAPFLLLVFPYLAATKWTRVKEAVDLPTSTKPAESRSIVK